MASFSMCSLLVCSALIYSVIGDSDGTKCTEAKTLVNGCSIPWGISFPYKDFFFPACERHDVCYSCGNLNGWKRSDCDAGFKKDMKFLCYLKEQSKTVTLLYFWQELNNFLKKIKGTFLVGTGLAKWLALKTGSLAHCLNGVDIYYNAVSNFAMKEFKVDKLVPECKFACVKLLADPTRSFNNTFV